MEESTNIKEMKNWKNCPFERKFFVEFVEDYL